MSAGLVLSFAFLSLYLYTSCMLIYIGFDIATENYSWSHVGFIFSSVCYLSVYALLRAANVFGCGYLVNLAQTAPKKMPMTQQKALWYSGLRGAMDFALALQSVHNLAEGHGISIRGKLLINPTLRKYQVRFQVIIAVRLLDLLPLWILFWLYLHSQKKKKKERENGHG
ncbi:unnamed protein product [Brassica rapa subsp. trilocularis]